MEKEISKFKLYATIISLGFTGGAIFIIPYIKFVFYDLQLQVTGMTNTQSALLLTVYTIVTIIIMIPSGALVDKIDVKKGLIIALVGTTAGNGTLRVYIHILCNIARYMGYTIIF